MLHNSLALLHNATFRVPSRRSESDEEHRRIVAAIEQRDPDGAEEAAREHIRQAQRTRFEGGFRDRVIRRDRTESMASAAGMDWPRLRRAE